MEILIQSIFRLSQDKNIIKPIYLHTQINTIDFYKRNGFVIKGDGFFEVKIEHRLIESQDIS